MWRSKEVSIGQLKAGTTKEVKFEYLGEKNLSDIIERITAGCGCTDAQLIGDNAITAKVHISKFPKQVNRNQTPIRKNIVVYYKEELQIAPDVLFIIGTLIK